MPLPASARPLALACWLLPACGNTSHTPETNAVAGSGQGGSAAQASTGLAIRGVVERRGSSCTVSGTSDTRVIGGGILDRALTSGYEAALLVESGSTEAMTIHSAQVSVETTDGRSVEAFESTTTGFVDGRGARGAGSFAALFATLLPPVVASRLELGTWRLRVRLQGNAQTSGTAVESSELLFPLELCEGCLVTYPEPARDPSSPDGTFLCLNGAMAAELAPGPDAACEVGLDAPAPCTTCSDQVPLCRDRALNPQH